MYLRNSKGEYVGGLHIARYYALIAFIAFICLGVGYSIIFAPLAQSSAIKGPDLFFKEGGLSERFECVESKNGFVCNDLSKLSEYINGKEGRYSGRRVAVTAYTSHVNQTDNSPCISADNKDICKRHANGEKLCASNDHPLGSFIHVEGLGVCKVVDRMNRRYTGTGRVDWYFGMDLEKARKHGIKQLSVTRL